MRSRLQATALCFTLVAACGTSADVETLEVTPPTSAPVGTSTVDPAPRAASTTAPAPTSTQTTIPPPTTTSSVPVFASATSAVTADDLHASWRPGCPVTVEGLRAVEVTHWGYDGAAHQGTLIVASEVAEDMIEIMGALFAARFPIERMEPIDVFEGDDDLSMAANNTSAFNCRPVTGGSRWSEHSYGIAIDVNPLINPYVTGDVVLPREGAAYADRTTEALGMIHADDVVVAAFADRGWQWGGYWSSPTDYQHFSTTGR
jgi:poly-gamma-glutamate synthesis protein (capsule biosynthesis protein)